MKIACFRSRTPSPEKPKANKYLRPENRWVQPKKPAAGAVSHEADGLPKAPPPVAVAAPSPQTNANNSNGTYMNVGVSGTVSKYDAPQMHHAERVTLRHDTTTEDEEEVKRRLKLS